MSPRVGGERYQVVKARPESDSLGGGDRLIVDLDEDQVVAIVYSRVLAETARDAFAERDGWPEAPPTLSLGPLTGDGNDARALAVDLAEGGFVAFRRQNDPGATRLVWHEVQELHTALGAWMERTKRS